MKHAEMLSESHRSHSHRARATWLGALSACAAACATAAVLSQAPASPPAPQPGVFAADATPTIDWGVYRGDPKGNQYSELAQINATNVHRLRPAWEYHTRDATPRSTMHVNPIVVNGVMYITTHSMKAAALDARTGKELWSFDPAPHNGGTVLRMRNRGVAYWKGAEGERIFHFVRERVYGLDAKTGKLVASFGKNGVLDLRENLGVDPARVIIEMTSPGAVYKNLLILGSRVNESYDAAPGHIRAFDTVSGQLKWIFHTIPRERDFGYDTWRWVKGENYGGANAWGGITIDEQRGWVFAATGSATEDFYGAFRKGNNLFANCVLALDAMTGERKWHYQTVRHDIWDYDNPSAPILVTLRAAGNQTKDAVVQLTKMGLTFVLDRDTGTPLFPVHDLPVPGSDVPGEVTSPTQPFPLKPQPLVRLNLTESDLTNITPESRAFALKEFRRYQSGPIYTPPTLRGTLTTPGFWGGVEWHGASFDPQLNVLYVNANDVPTIHSLRAVHDATGDLAKNPTELGRVIYEKTCVACHGADRKGVPPLIPPLAATRLSNTEIETVIKTGRNSMPAFAHFRPREMEALVTYLQSPAGSVAAERPGAATNGGAGSGASMNVDRYTVDGYRPFFDQLGVPAVAPPWGTLNAIDLKSGDVLWKVPLGEYPHLVAKGIRNTGTVNFGGAVATAGGLIFIAATADEKIRAFEKHTGRLLWEYELPAGGYATPSVYMVEGRQYVVISAGGGAKNATKTSDSIVAFALPDVSPSSPAAATTASASAAGGDIGVSGKDGWIDLFDGQSLRGWVHMNGAHNYTVEDGAIVGRTVESSAQFNSFLCSLQEFGDFELELETTVDRITNQGIQIRTRVRPWRQPGRPNEAYPGRINGPQVEVRRYYKGQPTTGTLYGEALGTDWLSSQAKLDAGHQHFVDEGWNKLRIVARGPRITTWVNGHMIDDVVNEGVYKTNPYGFIALQVHGVGDRELSMPIHAGSGVTKSQPLVMKWRNIRVRPLAP
jgi:quinoprotein glucose dehydrogenase